MKYAIVTGTLIVDTTNSEFGAGEFAAKQNPSATFVPFVTDEVILNDPAYPPGRYITTDIRNAQLFEKNKIINPGYLYNTHTYEIKHINTWTIMEIIDVARQGFNLNLTADNKNMTDYITIQQVLNNPKNTNSPNISDSKTNSKTNSIPIANSANLEKSTNSNDPEIHVDSRLKSMNDNKPNTLTLNETNDNDTKNISTKIDSKMTVYNFALHPLEHQPSHSYDTQAYKNNAVINPTNNTVNNTVNNPINNPVNKPVNNTVNNNLLQKTTLSDVASDPRILSIGTQTKVHRDKIFMIINENIAKGLINEENIVIAVNDQKIGDIWQKEFPTCLVYGKPDTDLPYHMEATRKVKKMLIFDFSLTKDLITSKDFVRYIGNITPQYCDHKIIVMTQSSDVINSYQLNKIMSRVLLHNFTPDWINNVSANFIKKYPFIKDNKNLENNLVKCIRDTSCVVIFNNPCLKNIYSLSG